MRTKFNRFAIIPFRCSDCLEIIWLEKYRKDSCWADYADKFVDKKICKKCIKKYNIGEQI